MQKMKPQRPLANAELVPLNRPFVSELPKLRKLIAASNLVGLANDTKWNELITHIRNLAGEWRPMYRCNCIASDFISQFEAEWWHHLPFPLISVRWLEVTFIEEIFRGHLLNSKIVDHSPEIQNLLTKIGFEFEKGTEAFRIFAYAPKITLISNNKKHNQTLHTNGSPGGSLKSAVLTSPAQSRILLPQPPRLRLAPLCCHSPLPESRG